MKPFIVAEIGASHNGSLETALKLVSAAFDSGADAVKLQTWDVMTVSNYVIESGLWAGKQLKDLYTEAQLPWSYQAKVFEYCREIGIECFSTPFDKRSVDFLENLCCPIYKIASAEITDLDLIRYVASKGKAIIVSTGMATLDEIEAVARQDVVGDSNLTLLRCVSAYPAEPQDFNLRTMKDMGYRLGCGFGISDHTLGSAVAVTATAMGASVIEKHIGLDRTGLDGGFCSLPDEFTQMVKDCRTAYSSIGEVKYGPSQSEQETLKLRRSIWVTRDSKRGETIAPENIAVLRPQGGMNPDEYKTIIARKFSRAVRRGEPFTEDMSA